MRNRVLLMALIPFLILVLAVSVTAVTAATVTTSQIDNVNTKNVGTQLLIQEDPDISGNIVVYRKTKYPGTDSWSMDNPTSSIIYWKHLKTGKSGRITSSSSKQWNPAISGTRVVWQEGEVGDQMRIYTKNLATGSIVQLSSSSTDKPDISGIRVVYVTYKTGRYYINVKNLATGATGIVSTNNLMGNPSISGTRIVWTEYVSSHSYIFIKNLATGAKARIGTDGRVPDISGNKIVWESNGVSYWRDLVTGAGGMVANGYSPKIDGSRVVFERQEGSNVVIYVKNLVTKSLIKINQQYGGQFGFQPVISGTIVVWQDWKPYLFLVYWKDVLTRVGGRVQL